MTGDDFRLDRENRGLSQEQMAAQMKVSVDVVRSIESGGIPRPANRFKVAAFYGKTVSEVWPLDQRKDAA